MAAVFPDDEVRIIDCIAERLSYKQLFEKMQEFKPTWVISNPISSTFSHDTIVFHYGKSLGAKTVAISPHTKVLREESLERFKSLNYAVDYTKGGFEPEFLLRQLIKGVSAVGTTIADIPPARQDLLPRERYNLPFIGRGYTFVTISRGCSWKCIYCRQTVMNESKVRFRPVATIIEEIKKYGLRNIAIHSDTATQNKKWIYDFCRALRELPFKVRIVSNSRVDTVDRELLREMRSAGWWMICYGIESGNNEVLKMNKKEATIEQAKQAVKWAKEAGLKVWGYFMLGMYGDNKKSMLETMQLSQALPLDIVNFAISAPYPGTLWGKIAEDKGWLVDKRWEAYDQNYSAQVSQPGCEPDVIKRIQRKAYLRWYLSWRGIRFLISSFKLEYLSYFWKTMKDHLR